MPDEAFHSDVLPIQAPSYYIHHELVIEYHLLQYSCQACADGPEQFLEEDIDILNVKTDRSQLYTSLSFMSQGVGTDIQGH